MRIQALVTAAATLLVVVNSATAQDAAKLQDLMDDVWTHQVAIAPLFATRVGVHDYNSKLDDVSLESQAAHINVERKLLARLKEISKDNLDLQGTIDWEIVHRLLDERINGYELNAHLMPITNRSGFHIYFPELPKQMSLSTSAGYENYIARLEGFLGYTRQHIELLREAIRQGYTLPAVVLKGYGQTITAHIVEKPEESLLYSPFVKFPASIDATAQSQLRTRGTEAIEKSVIAGYREFLEFFNKEYLPAARKTIGASDLPNGPAYYLHTIRVYTTMNSSPDSIHAVGVKEVARIQKEMDALRQRVKFDGDHKAFIEFLRTDPRFYAKTREELMQHVALILKKMDGQLPSMFRKLPRTPYGLMPIPDYIAPKTSSAYYSEPAGDGSRPGVYYLNTYDLKSRPLFEMEALSFHEAVPGHHLQIALAQEMTNVHPLRRFTELNAFVEGWALYSERLGLEAGFYQDPYSDFGRLSFEMWRACRLVVDTGIHALGWTRDEAVAFMGKHTALSPHNIESEVDRYISWPGQALGYKLGELKIRELRAKAEKKLGDEFDLREFHDVILRNGSVPLDVLGDVVEAYLKEKTPQ